MNRVDFGRSFGMGDAITDAASKAATTKATRTIEEGGSGGCGGDTCGKSAAASNAAQAALGPAGQPVSAAQLAALCADKSPSGQAACEAAKKKNAEIEKQNAERAGVIQSFVQDAIGGSVTNPQQLALGDATLNLYNQLIAKYGPEVKYLTLQQLKDKYPEDAKAIVMSLSSQFPALVGKDFDTVWNTIAPTFKDMQLIDLAAAIPNSSWKKTPASGSSNLVLGGGVTAILLVGGLAYFAFGRKKNVQAQS